MDILGVIIELVWVGRLVGVFIVVMVIIGLVWGLILVIWVMSFGVDGIRVGMLV